MVGRVGDLPFGRLDVDRDAGNAPFWPAWSAWRWQLATAVDVARWRCRPRRGRRRCGLVPGGTARRARRCRSRTRCRTAARRRGAGSRSPTTTPDCRQPTVHPAGEPERPRGNELGTTSAVSDAARGRTATGSGGEGGIRTRDGLPQTAFPVRRHSPLGDLSERQTIVGGVDERCDRPSAATSRRLMPRRSADMAVPGKAEPSTGASAPEGA